MSRTNKKNLYVGGLDDKVTEELLKAAFIPFGDIKNVTIPRDFTALTSSGSNDKSGSKGYGFVEFEDVEDAAAAIDNMNGAEIFNRTIEVTIARPMKEHRTAAIWEAADTTTAEDVQEH